MEIYRRLSVARLFIENNFYQPIKLEDIASEVQMNKFHFLRLFRQFYQETPHQFLTHKRIKHACWLLKKDHLSVIEICEQLGFESLASFSLLFKQKTGFSPTQYRCCHKKVNFQ